MTTMNCPLGITGALDGLAWTISTPDGWSLSGDGGDAEMRMTLLHHFGIDCVADGFACREEHVQSLLATYRKSRHAEAMPVERLRQAHASAADPQVVARLQAFLQGGLWHVTSAASWALIRQSGAIRPNVDGRYKMGGLLSPLAYSFRRGVISVWDFREPAERAWGTILGIEARHRPSAWLKIDAAKIGELIPHGAARVPIPIPGTSKTTLPIVQDCEAFCPADIAVDCIEEAHVFASGIAAHLGRAAT